MIRKLEEIIDRIDALSIRERGIILLGIIFIMYSVWDTYYMQQQANREKKILAELQVKRAEQSAMNLKFRQLVDAMQGDPDTAKRKKLNDLKSQLTAVEADVRDTTEFLIPPAKMAAVLRAIMNRTQGLELIEIKGLGSSPLLASGGEKKEAVSPQDRETGELENAYKHGLVIRFEGDFMSTLNFVREIESLQWGFFWDSLDFEVIGYPRSRVALTLYTLSLEKNWIGV